MLVLCWPTSAEGCCFCGCTLLVSYAGRIPAEGLSVFVVYPFSQLCWSCAGRLRQRGCLSKLIYLLYVSSISTDVVIILFILLYRSSIQK